MDECWVEDDFIMSLEPEQFPLVEELNITGTCLTRDSLPGLLTSFPNLRILEHGLNTLRDTDLRILAAKVHIQNISQTSLFESTEKALVKRFGQFFF